MVLKYVDDAINSLTARQTLKHAYLNELNAGRINTGPAIVGSAIDFGIFLIGQYTEDGHVFLMRKREDGSIETTIVKFIVVQEGFITVLKNL